MYFFRVQTKNIPSKATQVRTFVGSCTFKRDKVQARPRHRFFGLSIRVFDGGVKYIPFKKVFWTEDKRGLSANRLARWAHTRMTKEIRMVGSNPRRTIYILQHVKLTKNF